MLIRDGATGRLADVPEGTSPADAQLQFAQAQGGPGGMARVLQGVQQVAGAVQQFRQAQPLNTNTLPQVSGGDVAFLGQQGAQNVLQNVQRANETSLAYKMRQRENVAKQMEAEKDRQQEIKLLGEQFKAEKALLKLEDDMEQARAEREAKQGELLTLNDGTVLRAIGDQVKLLREGTPGVNLVSDGADLVSDGGALLHSNPRDVAPPRPVAPKREEYTVDRFNEETGRMEEVEILRTYDGAGNVISEEPLRVVDAATGMDATQYYRLLGDEISRINDNPDDPFYGREPAVVDAEADRRVRDKENLRTGATGSGGGYSMVATGKTDADGNQEYMYVSATGVPRQQPGTPAEKTPAQAPEATRESGVSRFKPSSPAADTSAPPIPDKEVERLKDVARDAEASKKTFEELLQAVYGPVSEDIYKEPNPFPAFPAASGNILYQNLLPRR